MNFTKKDTVIYKTNWFNNSICYKDNRNIRLCLLNKNYFVYFMAFQEILVLKNHTMQSKQ